MNEKYLKMPFKEWDGITPLVLFEDDRYFFSEDDITDYSIDHNIKLADMELVICDPQYAWEIDSDYYADILPEDMSLDDCYSELAEAIEEVNKLIRKREKPISWAAGPFRTKINEE